MCDAVEEITEHGNRLLYILCWRNVPPLFSVVIRIVVVCHRHTDRIFSFLIRQSGWLDLTSAFMSSLSSLPLVINAGYHFFCLFAQLYYVQISTPLLGRALLQETLRQVKVDLCRNHAVTAVRYRVTLNQYSVWLLFAFLSAHLSMLLVLWDPDRGPASSCDIWTRIKGLISDNAIVNIKYVFFCCSGCWMFYSVLYQSERKWMINGSWQFLY